MAQDNEFSNYERGFPSQPETEISVEGKTLQPESVSEAEQLESLRGQAGANAGLFEFEQQAQIDSAFKAGEALGFGQADLAEKYRASGTGSALDKLAQMARDALSGFKKVTAVGLGAAVMTQAAENRPTPQIEPVAPSARQEQVIGKDLKAGSGETPEQAVVRREQAKIAEDPSTVSAAEGAKDMDLKLAVDAAKPVEGAVAHDQSQTRGAERLHPPLAKDNPQRQYLSRQESYLGEVARKENEVRHSRVESIKFALNQAEQYRQAAHDAGDKKAELEAVRELVQFRQRLEEEQKPITAQDFEKFDSKTKERARVDLARIPDEAVDAYQKYDAQREWLAGVVHSPAYEAKARQNEGLSPEKIAQRKEASLRDEISLNDQFHTTGQDNIGVRDPHSRRSRIRVRFGKIPPEKAQSYKESYPGAEHYQDVPVAVHEMEHEVTEGERGMSETAKRLYKEAYAGVGSETKIGAYLSKPEELDARKRVFEYELERNGIWKYGESFTQEHLQKSLELRKAGKLTDDSQVFLDLLKHEKIPEIMNTIAGNRIPEQGKDKARSA